MNDLLIQLAGLWNDAFKKDDIFHMQKIENCVTESFTEFGKNIFTQYIEGRKQTDVNFLIQIAEDNDIEKLTRIKGIGVKTAKAIIKAFRDPEILSMILELRELGLNFRED